MCEKVNGFNRKIDKCMIPLIKWLNGNNYKTVSCCCGHGRYHMSIVIEWCLNGRFRYYELLSNIDLHGKTKRFYKKDSDGYYYIPEVIGE